MRRPGTALIDDAGCRRGSDLAAARPVAEIDHLRGLAIALTLVAHVNAAFVQPIPWVTAVYAHAEFWGGVYLFFVISGYVITRGFWDACADRSRRFSSVARVFYGRRFFRIAPPAWLWIACTTLCAALFNVEGTFGDLRRNMIQAFAAATFTYNFVFPLWSAAFGIYWSLTFEEQFYLSFPLLARLDRRIRTLVLVAHFLQNDGFRGFASAAAAVEATMAKDIAVRKYVVRLSVGERERLLALIGKGKSPARRILKARILLKADVSDGGEGWSDSAIVAALETSASMVFRVRKQLVEEGFEAVLSRKQRAMPAIPRIFDGETEAKLIALACSQPPKGRARWTLRLLEEKVVELAIVARASDSTIQRTLKKTRYSRITASAG